MARLPQVNSDDGNWGAILNDYLLQSHAADGTLSPNTIGAPQLKQNSVTSAAIAPGAVGATAMADATIPVAKLSDLNQAITGAVTGSLAATIASEVATQVDPKVAAAQAAATAAQTALAAGSMPWAKVIDIPGSTWNPSDWTTYSSSATYPANWFSDGASIVQSGSVGSSTTTRALLNQKVLTGYCIVDVEVFGIAAAGSDIYFGVLIGSTSASYGGMAGGGTSYRLHMTSPTTAESVELEIDGTQPRLKRLMNWGNLGEWHKLRCVQFGGMASIYFDGVLIGSAGNNVNYAADATYVGLKCGSAAAKFRNLAVWNPVMPPLP